jgi:hypothetical protein
MKLLNIKAAIVIKILQLRPLKQLFLFFATQLSALCGRL